MKKDELIKVLSKGVKKRINSECGREG